MSESARTRFAALLLAAVACGVYAPAISVGFFSDDYEWLGRMNPTLEQPSYVFSVFFRDFNPVLHASFALDWIVGGHRPAVWHADSILLHGLASALLFIVCVRLRFPFWIALAGAALWALNVRLSEAVIWPAARGHQLAAVCGLGAVALMLGRNRNRQWLALGLLACGLFAKETTLFAMAAIPLFVPAWRKARGFLAGLIVLAAGFVALNVAIKGDLHTSNAGFEALLLKTPFILLRPLGLGDYARFDVWTLVLTALAFSAAAYLLRRSFGFAGLAWVLACTAPIVPLDKLSSRYLYLPAIGYTVAFCAVCMTVKPLLKSPRIGRLVRASLTIAVVAICLGNCILAQREIGDYRLLARPYGELVEQAAPALSTVRPGEVVAVVDAAPQTTIVRLTRQLESRGNITKLIPYRRQAIDGLIELPDLLNVARPRTPGVLGRAASEELPVERWFFYDGSAMREIEPPAHPPQRSHRAAWDDAGTFFGR